MSTEQEKLLKNYPTPISVNKTEIILDQMKYNVAKIYTKNGEKGTGFFCWIPFPDDKSFLRVFITNNHVINEDYLNKEEKIVISLYKDKYGNEIIKNIDLKTKMKYTNKDYDITIIEIDETKDKIEDFLELDPNAMEENSEITYIGEVIYTIGYPKSEEVKVSYGILKGRKMENEYDFNHLCSTEEGFSGSPILSLTSNKVIGVHKQSNNKNNFNIGSFIKLSIREFIIKNINNINNNTNNNANNNISDNKIKSMYDDFHNYYEKEEYENIPTILIENHSTYCRAGFVYQKENNENIIKETKIYPFEYSNNMSDLMDIYTYIFEELNIDPAEHSILVSDDSIDMKKDGFSLIEKIFDNFFVRGVGIIKPYLLQAYCNMFDTGVILDVGEKIKYIPIYESYPIIHAIKEFDFNIVKYIMDKLAKSGDIYMKTVNKDIAKNILKKFCNHENDLDFDYELPDGNNIILDKYLKKEIIEKTFDDNYFVNCLTDSIKKCDIDIQDDLIHYQFLTGEYSFGRTFVDYYNFRTDYFYKKINEILKFNCRSPHIELNRYYNGKEYEYCVANVMNRFLSVVTKEEYEEVGINYDIFRRKFFYNFGS